MAALAAIVLVVFSVVSAYGQEKSPISIDDFLTGRFGARSFGGQWISDDTIQYRGGNGDILLLNIPTNEISTRLPGTILSDLKADSYAFSPDGSRLLVSYDTQAQFRHSTTARFKVVDLFGGNAIDLANGSYLQSASWGPVDRSLIYILSNDIFYSRDISQDEATQITSTGIPNVIYNGVPDWVYEEEVLASGTAYWFSPGGNWLVYLEFNDTNVPDMTYQRYGQPGSLLDQYPEEVTIRYPKAGATNPTYKAYLVDLTNRNFPTTRITSQENDSVHFGFFWGGEEMLAELTMSRVQNESSLRVLTMSGFYQQTLNFESPRGWMYTDAFRLDGLDQFLSLSIESYDAGNGSGNWSHLVLRDLKAAAGSSGSARALTSGPITVLSIIDWQLERNMVYYSATEVNKPFVSQVYSVNTFTGESHCLSCGIRSPEGNNCSYATASFSTNFSYVTLTCSAPDPKIVAVYQNGNVLGTPVRILEDNAALREALVTKALPITVDGVYGGAQVRLSLPYNFNSSLKYPLLIYVYAGPGTNQITDGYSITWGTYLTSSLDVIYGLIDGRGSARRGDDNLFAGYRALGTAEIVDQINVTRMLTEANPWIDSARTAVWGWSYGGYATGRILELDTDNVFKCGISVAPVTSWLYYDSVYTERYMGLPTEQDNLKGYQDGDLVSNVNNLKQKKYYLIHGNADDNVHYQQSMLLSRALELQDVIFQQQSYPDENHSLGGVSRHLYHSMDKFWKECFDISQ